MKILSTKLIHTCMLCSLVFLSACKWGHAEGYKETKVNSGIKWPSGAYEQPSDKYSLPDE